MMYAQTAYTPVPARQSFDRPEPIPQPAPTYQYQVPHHSPPQPLKNPSTNWPLSVRRYVQRAFAADSLGATRQEMELKLRAVISASVDDGTLHTTDWDEKALPQQLIRNERASIQIPMGSIVTSSWRDQISPTHPTGDTNPPSNGASTKKRKSPDLSTNGLATTTPPWRVPSGSFESRLSYADKRPRGESKTANASKLSLGAEDRRRRFHGDRDDSASPTPAALTVDGPVVGRCQTLEKKYFRLTSAPNPETVRPLPVLEKTLDFLKMKWRKESNYSYICDQFKSLRQDLTVQHIRNDFTVSVYEIHARIALEKGDLGEYNQCQTQLRVLYAHHLGGHPIEFKAYRILYFIHTCNRTEMNDVLADLTPAEKVTAPIQHALETRSALALGNYHRFFQLYLTTPNMGAYLMDMFITRERLAALANMCKAYKPDVKLRFITEELAFESDEESAHFLCDHGCQDLFTEAEDGVRLLTAKVGNVIDSARAVSFQKVDIKGQI